MTSHINEISGDDLLNHLKSKSGQDRYPVKCQWEVTCRCNFRCVMCYTDCFNRADLIQTELSSDEIFRIMDEMKDAGLLEITWTGGEPMARPDFEAIYIKSVQSGFLTTVFTNASYINEHWIKIWKQYPPFKIETSIHGITNSCFDAVTQIPGSRSKVFHAIDLVAQAGIPLVVKLTGSKMNQSEIVATIQWMRDRGITMRFGGFLRRDLLRKEFSELQLSDSDLKEIILSDAELDKESSRYFPAKSDLVPVCHEGKIQFHVDAYGKLQLCSNNRVDSFDLRKGSFERAFYDALPHFGCVRKKLKKSLELNV